MTRTGALVWKEGRDHRAAVLVFAALVPLVSWPVQRWVFKFAEPEWTWRWIIPLCVGLAVAVVAADAFAMDLATSRMASFVALPTTLRRHFATRTLFLALVGAVIAAWTAAANVAIVAIWGKPDAVVRHLDTYDSAVLGLLMTAAGAAAVLVFSTLGVGGFRAVLGGAVLAAVAHFATDYASGRFIPPPEYGRSSIVREPLEWIVTTGVLFVAAYAGFIGSRANTASRQRGTLFAGTLLIAAFGLPAGAASWKVYRAWRITPTDPEISLEPPAISPDGRYIAVTASKRGTFAGQRSWIVRIDDARLFDWPRRNEWIYGWSKDGDAWVVVDRRELTSPDGFDWGRTARAETGETVAGVTKADIGKRVNYAYGFEARGTRWLRWNCEPSKTPKDAPKGVYAWTLWAKDDDKTRRLVEARSIPAPTPNVGQVLIATAEKKLALVDLAGGEPRLVADDVVGLRGSLAGSPDGRFYTVTTSKGEAVLDATTWKTVAGPYGTAAAIWCGVADGPSVLAVFETKDWRLERLVDVATGREIVPDPALDIRGSYESVQALADGRIVARASENRIILLDADGKFIRKLFPPEE